MCKVKAIIDGQQIIGDEGMSILEAAEQAGIFIPTLCYSKELTPSGSCRLCVVEVAGTNRLVGSCHTPIREEMVIYTRSHRVLEARRVIIELLLAGHTGPCVTDSRAEQCELHKIAAQLEVGPPRFSVRRARSYRVEDISPYVRRDMSKCILCRRCIRACHEIALEDVYSMAYRGFQSKVVVDLDIPLNKEVCKDCGLCIEYCPTSALTWPDGQKGPKREQGQKAKGKAPRLLEARRRETLLDLMKSTQRESGYISEASMADIARSLGLPLSEVYGVATFYAFLSVKPQGRHMIRVCKSLPCHMKNGLMVVESLEREIGIRPGETTPCGRFSLELTSCIGACDQAPAMQVNDDVHGHLTPYKISEILKSYL